jgi:hypothetical protein
MNSKDVGLASDVLKSLDPAQVGAVFSRLFAASIGDMVVVLSRPSAHKHHSLADIEALRRIAASGGPVIRLDGMQFARFWASR